MTEEEWFACAEPQEMFEFLSDSASDRKCWLFACACCRRIWDLLDERCRKAVETGEQYADGQVTNPELMEASEEAFCRRNDLTSGSVEEAAALATSAAV